MNTLKNNPVAGTACKLDPATGTDAPQRGQSASALSATGAAKASPEPALLSVSQAAALCNVSRTTWYNMTYSGTNPAAIKLRGRVLWKRNELLKWIEANCPPRLRWEKMQRGRR